MSAGTSFYPQNRDLILQHPFLFLHSWTFSGIFFLTEETMEKDADSEEYDGVSVYHVSPQRFLSCIGELQLERRLLLFSQFRGVTLIKATEPVVRLLETVRLRTFLCARQRPTAVISCS